MPTPVPTPTPTPTPMPMPTPIPVTPTPVPTATPTAAAMPTPNTGINRWWTYQEKPLAGVGKAMVNVANGNLPIQSDDIDIHERGIDLAFAAPIIRRATHSASTDGATPSLFGNGWTNTFDAHLRTTLPGISSASTISTARDTISPRTARVAGSCRQECKALRYSLMAGVAISGRRKPARDYFWSRPGACLAAIWVASTKSSGATTRTLSIHVHLVGGNESSAKTLQTSLRLTAMAIHWSSGLPSSVRTRSLRRSRALMVRRSPIVTIQPATFSSSPRGARPTMRRGRRRSASYRSNTGTTSGRMRCKASEAHATYGLCLTLPVIRTAATIGSPTDEYAERPAHIPRRLRLAELHTKRWHWAAGRRARTSALANGISTPLRTQAGKHRSSIQMGIARSGDRIRMIGSRKRRIGPARSLWLVTDATWDQKTT